MTFVVLLESVLLLKDSSVVDVVSWLLIESRARLLIFIAGMMLALVVP